MRFISALMIGLCFLNLLSIAVPVHAQTSAATSRVRALIPTAGSRKAGTLTRIKISRTGVKSITVSGPEKPYVNAEQRQRWGKTIKQAAKKFRLEPALLHAVISAESSFNPKALSVKGAIGLMQLMPATAERFSVEDPYDPVDNIYGGARYLRLLLNQFKDIQLALAAYNAGENAVLRYGKQIPPYPETLNYVRKVLAYYSYFQKVSS